ncbi:ATP-binding cassette domain-containing protein [Sinorhizobium sp. BJ1]|uniref:ATP-binding cassette domain-containing protein n=1 Tax=Sinorhizobium sp. BJ1 TaxID=2035455 RepID=UPI001FE0DED4|nr:ATP-binding cassette domain-containing protein [Sinorhizobium sp. BJ1]
MDFSVKRGEIHALLGGNGAGKSTLIGELVFRDAAGNILTETDGRRKVAVVHQELALLPHLTVAENIALPHFRKGSRPFRPKDGRQPGACRLVDDRSGIRRDRVEPPRRRPQPP